MYVLKYIKILIQSIHIHKNYKENLRNTSTFMAEQFDSIITIVNVTVNNKTHKLSLTAIIKDFLTLYNKYTSMEIVNQDRLA